MSASGGQLRVGVVVPVSAGGVSTVANALTEHHDVATTLAVSQDYGEVSKAATCMSATTSAAATEMAATGQAIFNLQNPAG